MPWDSQDAKDTSEVIVNWMIKDVDMLIKNDANYAAALCILVYAEALGRLVKGTLLNPSYGLGEPAFVYFLGKMGYDPQESKIIYDNLRHGMAHSYIPMRYANFTKGRDKRGIDTADTNNIKVHLLSLYDEFEGAARSIPLEISQPNIGNYVMPIYAKCPYFDSQISFYHNVIKSSGNTTAMI